MKTNELTTYRFTNEEKEITVEASCYTQALDMLIWEVGGDENAAEWILRS